jgi:hypothetical protein
LPFALLIARDTVDADTCGRSESGMLDA